jgi:hypothetical protein
MAETLANFFDRVVGDKPGFTSQPWYNRDGDCIHYHWREDEFYRERLDDKLTVYRSQETREAVGFVIKGVAALRRKLGDYSISVKDTDGTPMALFVMVSQATASDFQFPRRRQEMYQYLLEQVGKQKVEVPDETADAGLAVK